ncbi:MAG TPA: universal stress protein [Phycicoccus sp.]|nr:universal stress protein [Phycicoccus sp.]
MASSSSSPSRLVVGVDGSHLSRAAVQWAAHSAQLRGLDLHLVHALAGDLPMLGFGSRSDQEAIHSAGSAVLEGAKHLAHTVAPEVTVTTSCRKGFASQALVDASKIAAGVVVGAAGHGVLHRSGVGAVAMQVATHAKCPVAVIPRETATEMGYGVVLTGFDRSTTAAKALQRAFDHALVRGARLHVIHAWEARSNDPRSMDAHQGWSDYVGEMEDLIAQSLSDRRAAHPEVEVTTEIVRGDPRRVVADRGTGADLIVIGARGDGGFPGLNLGRVALHTMGHSVCPVILLR